MDRLWQDLRLASRLLWRDRGFALTTIVTLAVCLAANVVIFATVSAVLLRPLPFPDPERIVTVNNAYPGAGVPISQNGVPDYFDRLDAITAFNQFAMYRTTSVTLGGAGRDPERVTSMTVSSSFFTLLSTSAYRGRLLNPEDEAFGQHRQVVLSHGLWERMFGGSDAAVGSDLRINGTPFRIVGVAPPSFRFIDPDVQLWTPAAFTAQDRADDRRHSNNWNQMGRLRDGSTIEQAQAQLDSLNASNLERFPQMREVLLNAGFHTRAAILQEELIADVATTLYLLWGGVVVVLVVGAVNVANLASIRATAQSRELATRAALGASVGRLSRQLLTEALMLATVGALAGLVLGAWALRASPLLGFDRLPRGDEISLDALTLVAVGALVLVVGLGVGLLPIQVLRRTNLAQSVREEGRSGTATRATQVTRRGLVTVQVASALVLLTGAGLLMASFQRVLAINPGFQADRVLSGWVSLPASRYAEPAQLRAQALRLLEGVRSVPGVTSAGLSTTLPLGGGYSDSVIIAEGYQMAPGESLISPNDIVVSEGFFESLQIRLVEGRFFDARDAEYPPRVMIVDEQLANRFWKGQSAVGRRLYHPGSPDRLLAPPPEDEWFTVVGVVESVRLAGMTDTEEFQRVGAYYAPYPQRPARTFSLAIRSAGDPAALVNTVRAAIAQADPELPFFDVQTLADRVDRSLVDRRTPMVLAAGFAGAALFLAAVGLYGVLAYQVAQRRREIGVRLALGADGRDIFSMVLWEGALIVGVGAVMGLAGAFFLRELWASQLYEVGSMDPRVVAGVSVLLAIVALVACLLPARRAASTDPIAALQAP